jgi:hypothetical protein
MAAATYNLTIDQGSDFNIDLVVKEGGSVKNLAGYSARAQLRAKRDSSTVAASFDCTVTSASEGKIRMQLSNAASSGISAGRYYYDLEIYTATDAIVKRLIQGEVTLNQEVTR